VLARTLGDGPWALDLFGTTVFATSVAELAFAYGTATRSTWAARPASRALGFAGAFALLAVGFWIALSAPVSVSESPIGQPVETPSGDTRSRCPGSAGRFGGVACHDALV
jgi:hypothetical protein